jgi:hypothetical protein
VEATELAVIAVGAVTAVAAGAAGSIGEGAGTAVAELVRARLAGSERGRAALQGLDTDPENTAARSEARDALREEIEADPELQRQLVTELTSSETHTSGSIVLTGSKMSRSQISLGPLTINNTRSARSSLAVAAALLALLVALGAYGGTQLITTDDSPDDNPSSDGTQHTSRALTVEETRQVPPDMHSMPAGWQELQAPTSHPADSNLACHSGASEYTTPSLTDGGPRVYANFYVAACESPRLASDVFADAHQPMTNDEYGQGWEEVTFPNPADEVAAVRRTTYDEPVDQTTGDFSVFVRAGTVVCEVEVSMTPVDEQLDVLALAEELTGICVERAWQTQSL